jgi:hypothetical protein
VLLLLLLPPPPLQCRPRRFCSPGRHLFSLIHRLNLLSRTQPSLASAALPSRTRVVYLRFTLTVVRGAEAGAETGATLGGGGTGVEGGGVTTVAGLMVLDGAAGAGPTGARGT